jgi:hypothetical protein
MRGSMRATESPKSFVRLSDALQARCKVRRLTDDAALLRLSQSDQIADYDQASGDTDAGLQWSSGLQPAHRLDQRSNVHLRRS